MNDDWRVQVTCPSGADAARLREQLREGEFRHDMDEGAGDRVIVSNHGSELFLYAGSRAQAERAAAAVKELAAASGAPVRTDLRCWHPAAEEWADAGLPLPDNEAALAAEHAEVIERERADAARLGRSAYEVRVGTSSHRDTVALADALRREEISCLRRWRYLLIGAADEDAAAAIAARVRALAPDGATIEVEATTAAVAQVAPANPFAVFGGLGG